MTTDEIQEVMTHYREWSGGFPPDAEEQIFIYMEYARLTNIDEDETREFLREWAEYALEHPEEDGSPGDGIAIIILGLNS
jgi:hypothetical protein